MSKAFRTVVTFRSSAFNTSESRDYFINPSCFGDDLARWLMEELRRKGISTDDEPDQEDFGWFFEFKLPDNTYCLIIGHLGVEEGTDTEWFLALERSRGCLASILGGRNRGLQKDSAEVIHSILSGSARVSEVRWHDRKDFHRGMHEAGASEP